MKNKQILRQEGKYPPPIAPNDVDNASVDTASADAEKGAIVVQPDQKEEGQSADDKNKDNDALNNNKKLPCSYLDHDEDTQTGDDVDKDGDNAEGEGRESGRENGRDSEIYRPNYHNDAPSAVLVDLSWCPVVPDAEHHEETNWHAHLMASRQRHVIEDEMASTLKDTDNADVESEVVVVGCGDDSSAAVDTADATEGERDKEKVEKGSVEAAVASASDLGKNGEEEGEDKKQDSFGALPKSIEKRFGASRRESKVVRNIATYEMMADPELE